MSNLNHSKHLPCKRERTRQAIIHAAITVIAEKNLANASIDDLMQAADMARATFYNHFQSREEVLHAVVEELRFRLHENVERNIHAEASAEEIIACMLYGILQYSLDNPANGRALVRIAGDMELFFPYNVETGQFERADQALLSITPPEIPFSIIHTYIEGAVHTLLRRTLQGHLNQEAIEQLMAFILRGIGMDEADIGPSINAARCFAREIHLLQTGNP